MTNTTNTTPKAFADMTIPQKFQVVHALLKAQNANADILDFIKGRAEAAAKKSAKAKAKPTKTQLEAAALKVAIHEYMVSVAVPVRANDVFMALELSSPQKATNLLTALVKEGKAVRHEEKKVVTFTAL